VRVVITGAAGKIGRAEDGQGSFRFRYLLPMAVEVQFYAAYARD
jgi:hypothetical protein